MEKEEKMGFSDWFLIAIVVFIIVVTGAYLLGHIFSIGEFYSHFNTPAISTVPKNVDDFSDIKYVMDDIRWKETHCQERHENRNDEKKYFGCDLDKVCHVTFCVLDK